MNSQAIATLIVWAVALGAGILALVIFRGFIQWLLGISDLIRLQEEGNTLLKAQIELQQTIANQEAARRLAELQPEPPQPMISQSSPTQRRNPLTGK